MAAALLVSVVTVTIAFGVALGALVISAFLGILEQALPARPDARPVSRRPAG